MKVHAFNLLLLLTVAICLCITLSRSTPEERPAANMHQAFITLSPAATPHPLDAYRTAREAQRALEMESLAALCAPEYDMQPIARETLLSLQTKMERELQTEGMLAGLGYERAVCVLTEDTLSIFTEKTLSEKHLPLILQSAGEICQIPTENVHWVVP